jgi:hypothetical protein
MQKVLLTLLGIFVAVVALAQVSGTVTDEKGEPLIGVNVYLKGTYDGATTDINGNFSFQTDEKGAQVLVVSFIGFKQQELPIDVSDLKPFSIQLKEEVSILTGITITAGSFEASDEKKAVVLKPLDIAMTAGATADIAGALNTLPGTTTNPETGRLFVRGGTAGETQAFIDGVVVQNFYSPSPNNVPTRARFSPFLFKGTFFSTGGYSAEYGEALSSVLSLSSQDLPDETRTELSFMTIGADVAHTQRWERGSIYGQVAYTNLDPYNNLVNQEYDWKQGFQSLGGTTMLRQQLGKDDMLKVYASYDVMRFAVNMPNINLPEGDDIDLRNANTYVNANYRKALGERSTAYLGISNGYVQETATINDMEIKDTKSGQHLKGYFTTDITQVSLKVGAEVFANEHTEDVTWDNGDEAFSSYRNDVVAAFAESDYYITNSLTLRTGVRFTHYDLINSQSVAPRVSMAYKTGQFSQLSWAYGQFQQMPLTDVLIRSQQVDTERADHFIFGYQRIKDRRTFRAEVYYKDYKNLVKFDASNPFDPTAYTNTGEGYATGLDVFYRDSKTIKSGDFWITYSFMDARRDFRNYPTLARPGFVAAHNAAVVYKHFIPSLKTQIGASYTFNSGRPYDNPNEEGFNESVTKPWMDLSFNFAYLPKQNMIIYTSCTNLLGRDNVFGYQFADTPDVNGQFDSRTIGQPAKRFFFIGVFITLTKDRAKNTLETLN